MPVATANGGNESSAGSTPQEIDYRDYQSESSELDMREVDPMDELSDFESDSQQSLRLQLVQEQAEEEPIEQPTEQAPEQPKPTDQSLDVEMDAAEEENGAEADAEAEEDEKEHTVCEVCKSSEREAEIMLCDDCDAEYHIFCLQPPLPKVPEGTWYCPQCRANHPEAEAAASSAPPATVDVKQEKVRAAAASAGASDNGGAGAATADGATSAAAGTTVNAGGAPPVGNAPTREADDSDPTSISVSGDERRRCRL
jgi:hypothetical protein